LLKLIEGELTIVVEIPLSEQLSQFGKIFRLGHKVGKNGANARLESGRLCEGSQVGAQVTLTVNIERSTAGVRLHPVGGEKISKISSVFRVTSESHFDELLRLFRDVRKQAVVGASLNDISVNAFLRLSGAFVIEGRLAGEENEGDDTN